MSTKEMLYTMIDELTERQMLELIDFMKSRKKKGKPAAAVMGALAEYADSSLIPLEEKSWEEAVKKNYENS